MEIRILYRCRSCGARFPRTWGVSSIKKSFRNDAILENLMANKGLITTPHLVCKEQGNEDLGVGDMIAFAPLNGE